MISILMPVYNGVEFLPDSISSVLDQTITDWELLIGVNGMPPNSYVHQICVNHAEIDRRIRVYDFPDCKSKSETLNELVKLVNNEIVCLLDVDDMWHTQKLEEQISYISNYDVVGTMAQYFGARQDIPPIPLKEILPQVFSYVNPIINSSSMFKLSKDIVWNRDFEGVEDYELWSRLNFARKRFYNVPKVLVGHRIHQESFFNTKDHSEKISEIRKRWAV